MGEVLCDSNVISLQISTADIMRRNRVDRIVLDPNRTHACTRTPCTGHNSPKRGIPSPRSWRDLEPEGKTPS